MTRPDEKDEQLALIASITHGLPVALWVAKVPNGDFVYANRMFGEIMGVGGLDGPAVGGYSEPYGIHGLDGALYPEERMPFVQVLQQKTTITLDDIVIHRPDGNRRHVRAIAKPLFGNDGEMNYIAITFTDITREIEAERGRAETEARLFHAQKMESIGNLASGVAHDFNNLLASIKILASLLRMDERDPSKIENLDRIDQSAESALRLTRSLLGFARADSARSGVVSVNRSVEEVVDVFTRTIDPRIVVETKLETADSNVLGDSSRLEQVLFNLLINARDALPEGGRIRVRTAEITLRAAEVSSRPPLRAGKHVVLEVTDDGVGIPPAVRHRIFEPYFTTKNDGPIRGTGLGLAMVYGIVQAHGGWIEPLDAVPRGTTMRIFIPQATNQRADDAQDHTPSRELSTGKGLVLLAEDDPDVRRAATLALRKIGYDVEEAHDGIEAVAAFKARSAAFSLVLLDMAMPRLNGRDTYNQIRAIRPDMPVVLSSGSALNDEARNLLALGARAFLEKPYDVKTLAETLAKVQR